MRGHGAEFAVALRPVTLLASAPTPTRQVIDRPNVAKSAQNKMKLQILSLTIAGVLSAALLSTAAEGEDGPIKEAMKKYHKAPQGTDPVAKRAAQGKATKQELKDLAEGYRKMAKAKPPQGDEASWKEKTSKIVAAATALERGEAGAVDKYKEASNCKACHDVHKPKQK